MNVVTQNTTTKSKLACAAGNVLSLNWEKWGWGALFYLTSPGVQVTPAMKVQRCSHLFTPVFPLHLSITWVNSDPCIETRGTQGRCARQVYRVSVAVFTVSPEPNAHLIAYRALRCPCPKNNHPPLKWFPYKSSFAAPKWRTWFCLPCGIALFNLPKKERKKWVLILRIRDAYLAV